MMSTEAHAQANAALQAELVASISPRLKGSPRRDRITQSGSSPEPLTSKSPLDSDAGTDANNTGQQHAGTRKVRLLELLSDEVQKQLFKQFCQECFILENFNFWEEVERYKALVSVLSRAKKAMLIYNTFLKAGSPEEVNISSEQRKDLRQQILGNIQETNLELLEQVFHRNLFMAAQRAVVLLMQNDAYDRFQKYPPYLALIKERENAEKLRIKAAKKTKKKKNMFRLGFSKKNKEHKSSTQDSPPFPGANQRPSTMPAQASRTLENTNQFRISTNFNALVDSEYYTPPTRVRSHSQSEPGGGGLGSAQIFATIVPPSMRAGGKRTNPGLDKKMKLTSQSTRHFTGRDEILTDRIRRESRESIAVDDDVLSAIMDSGGRKMVRTRSVSVLSPVSVERKGNQSKTDEQEDKAKTEGINEKTEGAPGSKTRPRQNSEGALYPLTSSGVLALRGSSGSAGNSQRSTIDAHEGDRLMKQLRELQQEATAALAPEAESDHHFELLRKQMLDAFLQRRPSQADLVNMNIIKTEIQTRERKNSQEKMKAFLESRPSISDVKRLGIVKEVIRIPNKKELGQPFQFTPKERLYVTLVVRESHPFSGGPTTTPQQSVRKRAHSSSPLRAEVTSSLALMSMSWTGSLSWIGGYIELEESFEGALERLLHEKFGKDGRKKEGRRERSSSTRKGSLKDKVTTSDSFSLTDASEHASDEASISEKGGKRKERSRSIKERKRKDSATSSGSRKLDGSLKDKDKDKDKESNSGKRTRSDSKKGGLLSLSKPSVSIVAQESPPPSSAPSSSSLYDAAQYQRVASYRMWDESMTTHLYFKEVTMAQFEKAEARARKRLTSESLGLVRVPIFTLYGSRNKNVEKNIHTLFTTTATKGWRFTSPTSSSSSSSFSSAGAASSLEEASVPREAGFQSFLKNRFSPTVLEGLIYLVASRALLTLEEVKRCTQENGMELAPLLQDSKLLFSGPFVSQLDRSTSSSGAGFTRDRSVVVSDPPTLIEMGGGRQRRGSISSPSTPRGSHDKNTITIAAAASSPGDSSGGGASDPSKHAACAATSNNQKPLSCPTTPRASGDKDNLHAP
ncbi:GTPase-activating protein [Balamuthia mandrillaris]